MSVEARQVDEAARNADLYVCVVENVKQGDPAKFELRVLGGRQLQELLAQGKEHRYFKFPVRAADYNRLPRLEEQR